MQFAAVCLSHSPLANYPDFVSEEQESEVARHLSSARELIEKFNPDLVIQFGPDHYGGFAYGLLPSFCIGIHAQTAGDFNTSRGWLDIPQDEAQALAREILAADVDIAISHRMKVDHGFTQVQDQLFGGHDKIPIIPIFINCLAEPAPANHRVKLLGEAVGKYARNSERRILFLSSGGLSHDPPFPGFDSATLEVRECLVKGYEYTPDFMEKRVEKAREIAQVYNTPKCTKHELNENWDRALLDKFASGNLEEVAALSDKEITEEGGNGAREIKTWLAALSALQGCCGDYQASVDYYKQIPQWLISYSIFHAFPKEVKTINR